MYNPQLDTFIRVADAGSFNKAAENMKWENVHPLLKIIPVEWEYTIPFGILHSPNPSGKVQRFLKALQLVVSTE